MLQALGVCLLAIPCGISGTFRENSGFRHIPESIRSNAQSARRGPFFLPPLAGPLSPAFWCTEHAQTPRLPTGNRARACFPIPARAGHDTKRQLQRSAATAGKERRYSVCFLQRLETSLAFLCSGKN